MKNVKSSFRSRKNRSLPGILTLALVGFLLGGVFLSSYFLRFSQENRQQAAATDPVVFKLQAQNVNANLVRFQVLINTKNNVLAGVQIVGDVTDVTKDDVSFESVADLPVENVTDKVVDVSGGARFSFTKFASLDTSKPFTTSYNDRVLASILVKKRSAGGAKLTLDSGKSMIRLLDGSSLVQWPGSYTMAFIDPSITAAQLDEQKKTCNQNCGTDTECQNKYQCYKGFCRLRGGNLDDDKCGVVPDQGIHRSCNQYCADTTECAKDLVCYYNQCRNALNIKDSSCAAPKKVAVKPASTGTGTGGTTKTKPPVIATVVFDATKSSAPVATTTATPTEFESAFEKALASTTPTPSPTAKPTVKPTASPKVVTTTTTNNSGKLLGVMLIALGVIALIGAAWWFFVREK